MLHTLDRIGTLKRSYVYGKREIISLNNPRHLRIQRAIQVTVQLDADADPLCAEGVVQNVHDLRFEVMDAGGPSTSNEPGPDRVDEPAQPGTNGSQSSGIVRGGCTSTRPAAWSGLAVLPLVALVLRRRRSIS